LKLVPFCFGKDCSGETPKPAPGRGVLPGDCTGQFFIQDSSNSESRTCMAVAASPSSHSSFCEEVFPHARADRPAPTFFRAATETRTNEVDRTNILASGLWSGRESFSSQPFSAFLPPSPLLSGNDWLMGSRIQLQQRNCSRFARDFLRRSTVTTHLNDGFL
jgi:hypothetical protein